MQTVVTRIGRTVPAEFRGTVRAVWGRACAVAPDHGMHGVENVALVTLVRDDVPMTAASIALRLDPTFDFAARGFGVGDRVRSDGATIVVGTAGSSAWAEAEMREAEPFDGYPPEATWSGDLSVLEYLAAAARNHRCVMCGHNVLGAQSSQACDVYLEELSASAIAGDPIGAAWAASSLLGLGPGLTPAGDDALCGFMLGRRLSGEGTSTADGAINRIASSAAGRTSDVSAVQLELAAGGRFGEALLGVATALCAGKLPIASATARCLAEGATSGADGLLGLVAGLRASAAARTSPDTDVSLDSTERRKRSAWLSTNE